MRDRIGINRHLIFILVLIISLPVWLASCRPNENEGGPDWAQVSFNINQPGASEANGRNANTIGVEFLSSLILAIPETALVTESGSTMTAIKLLNIGKVASTSGQSGSTAEEQTAAETYEQVMLRADGSVEMTLPLNEAIRIIQYTFSADYDSVSEALDHLDEIFSAGISESITIASGTTEQTVNINLVELYTTDPTDPTDPVTPTGNAIGGTITDLVNSGLILQLEVDGVVKEALPITGNGTFTFLSLLLEDESYAVSVQSYPALEYCSVTNASGTMVETDISNVNVTCLTVGACFNDLDLTTTNAVTSTLAGSGSTGSDDNATGILATFNAPKGITTDKTNLYVADTDNHLIRKIVIGTSEVTNLAGDPSYTNIGHIDDHTTGTLARFDSPQGITGDGTYLYVADTGNHSIRRINIVTTAVSTFAGATMQSDNGNSDNTTGTLAKFDSPTGITILGDKLYVADSVNNAIRMIDINTTAVTTLVSTGLNNPIDITTDGKDLYVVDQGYYQVKKVTLPGGTVTTLAGSSEGWLDATGTSAKFGDIRGIACDGINLYVSHYFNTTGTNNHMIRRITLSGGVVTTFAGTNSAGSADGTGQAATFYDPAGLVTDGSSLFITDTTTNKIRRITPTP